MDGDGIPIHDAIFPISATYSIPAQGPRSKVCCELSPKGNLCSVHPPPAGQWAPINVYTVCSDTVYTDTVYISFFSP